MTTRAHPTLAIAVLSLAACDPVAQSDPSAASSKPAAVAPSGTASASSPSSAALAPPEGPPACTVSARKAWGKGANKTTGLATTELPDGRVAVGLALGTQPHVLVISPGGEGKIIRVGLKQGSPLSKPLKAEDGIRQVLRVTPVKVDGDAAHAFVDYRDEYKNKRRRVACGPAESDGAWIHFDDVPFLDRDPKPTGKEREELFKSHAPAPAAPAAAKAAPAAEKDAGAGDAGAKDDHDHDHDHEDTGYHELRDCRSFVDVTRGSAWIVGSVLRASDKPDGTLEWSASLVVDTGPNQHEEHLHEIVLKGDPPTLRNFEVPISRPLGDGMFLLAARFGSTLRAGILNPNRTLRGKLMSYAGLPTLPNAASDDGDTVLVTSIAKDKGLFALRGLRIPGGAGKAKPELPKGMLPIDTHSADKGHNHAHGHDHDHDHVDHSETDPAFVRDSKGRRWVSYIEGDRGKGHLQIVPVDEKFDAIGKPFLISASAELASEARLVPMSDGAILVVSIRDDGKGSSEVLTEELRCEIVKE